MATLTLNRPDARSALDVPMMQLATALVEQAGADRAVRVIVLTGEGTVFCAGADLKVIRDTGSAATLDTERGGFGGFVFRERTKPIVVAVDGLATAGGLEIVLAADIVVATSRSAFGLAEVRRNLIAAAGGLFRLPRAIGRGPAMDAVLTGEPIDGEEAVHIGLANRVVELSDLLDSAVALAATIGSKRAEGVRLTMEFLNQQANLSKHEALRLADRISSVMRIDKRFPDMLERVYDRKEG